MKIVNDGLPEPLFAAVNGQREPRAGSLSATELLNPPQQRAIMLQHWHEAEELASDRIWAALGSAMHMLLEKHGRSLSGHLAEERLSATIDGATVTGTFDLYYEDGTLTDYKFVGVATTFNGVKTEWFQQLNIYAWLLRENGFEVNTAQVWCIYRDWMKAKAGRDSYPAKPAQRFSVPLWSHEDAAAFVARRVRLHLAAEQGIYAGCTDDERWMRPTKYAVTKKGAQRASRLLDSYAEAVDWAVKNVPANKDPDKWFDISERPGEAVRCASYCAASAWCGQNLSGLREAAPMGLDGAEEVASAV